MQHHNAARCVLLLLLALCNVTGCTSPQHGVNTPAAAPLTARQTVGAACLNDRVRLPPGVLIGADRAALPGVWHVLDGYANEPLYRSALFVLGHIGSDEDALRLEAWINDPTRFSGLLELYREDNFRLAFVALGIMWSQGSEAAGQVLERMVKRDYWAGRDIRWFGPDVKTALSDVEETLCWVLMGSAYGGGDALLAKTDLVSKANDAAKEKLAWRLDEKFFSSRVEVGRMKRPPIEIGLRRTLESTFSGAIDLPIPLLDEQLEAQAQWHFKHAIACEAYAVFRAYASAIRSGRVDEIKYRLVAPNSRYHPLGREEVEKAWLYYMKDMIGAVAEFDHLFGDGTEIELDMDKTEVDLSSYLPFGPEIDEQRRHQEAINQGDVRVTLKLGLRWGGPAEPLPDGDHSGYRFSHEDEPHIYMLRKDGVWYWSPYGR